MAPKHASGTTESGGATRGLTAHSPPAADALRLPGYRLHVWRRGGDRTGAATSNDSCADAAASDHGCTAGTDRPGAAAN